MRFATSPDRNSPVSLLTDSGGKSRTQGRSIGAVVCAGGMAADARRGFGSGSATEAGNTVDDLSSSMGDCSIVFVGGDDNSGCKVGPLLTLLRHRIGMA